MKKRSTLIAVSLLFVASCATDVKKMSQPEDITPEMAVNNTETMKKDALMNQADVLARNNFKSGLDYLKEAKDDLGESDEAEEVIDDSAVAQTYFNKASLEAKDKASGFERVLAARKQAVVSGVHDFKPVKEKLNDIDEDFRDDTDNFTKSLSATSSANFQKRYMEIHVLAVQETKLGPARAVFKKLTERNAEDLAPNNFKTAKEDILLAENMIEKSTTNTEFYEKSVTKANESTKMLYDVMNVIKKNGDSTPESAAVKIVNQERKLGNLRTDLMAMGTISTAQEMAILSQADRIAFQKAMDDVRKDFSSNEAEVYQQGNQLIIRLKKMDFPVGKAAVPQSSEKLLAKVSKIVKDLDPSKVVIQGHTDSTGSVTLNKDLSKSRANSVASYLKNEGLNSTIDTIGFGSDKPLADNQTKEGRALNRRVDVVITAKNEQTE